MSAAGAVVAGVKWGTRYGPDYVNVLYRAVQANLCTVRHRSTNCFYRKKFLTEDFLQVGPPMVLRSGPKVGIIANDRAAVWL